MKYLALCSMLASIPYFTYAITAPRDFRGVVSLILSYVQLAIPVIFGLTFIVISWGVVRAWIINGGNEEQVGEGKMIVLWGVIGLVVMVGLWGIVALLRSSFFGM